MDPTIFQSSSLVECVILATYANNILVSGSDVIFIACIKGSLHQHHTIWDLGNSKYFLGINFAYQLGKYTFYIYLQRPHFLGANPKHLLVIESLIYRILLLICLKMSTLIINLLGSSSI